MNGQSLKNKLTNIQFIFNIPEKNALIYRIVNNYFQRNRSSLVYLEDKTAANNFSQMLWSNDKHSFLPHQINKSETINPICISHNATLMDDILINGTNKAIKYFSRYQKFYELVGLDELEKIAARERFLFYKECGYKIEAADMLNFNF